MASSSGSTKLCFNSTCKEALEVPRQGWLCRTGDFADLCDRCSSAFKDGKFCNTYHMNASGWRCCESCGKQIHCGCIVSFHMFILLDAGGIECINCAKSEYILTPNPTWPSSPHFLTGPAERIRDISSKNWRSIAGSGPVPWKQAPYLFNSSKLQPDFLSNIDKPLSREQLTSCSLTRSIIHDPSERLVNDSWQMTGDRAKATGVQYDGKHNLFQSFFSNELATPVSSLPATFMAQDQKSEKGKASGQFCPPPSVGKCCSSTNTNSPPGTSLESQTYSGKGQGEKRGRHQLIPRYWPRLTDQELQQISGGSNAKITPLFEKVLSASDAGRIGRLVLPKKCAEAYLPPISQPEGYPLVVQDLKGKDWVLQFRFWPNNNSRMYVLEGVTPCIQSMQLQAGDTVTFSRLEPEGKLVMGFRKASPSSPSYHVTEVSTHEEPSKGSFGNKSRNPDGTWAEVDKIAKRKKGGKMCSNNKHVKPNDEEIVRVNVTLEQVQGLLRPPLTNSSTIVVIEGVEFEDFQEEPIIGSPTNLSTISHASCNKNESENQGLDALANLAIQDGKATKSPSGTNHKSVSVHHGDEKHLEKEVGNVGQNPNELMYADVIRYNNNQNQKMGPSQSIEKVSTSQSFKSQNIDLNIQPEREEECSPVSDMGIMMLVQESTHRYIRQQKLSFNDVTQTAAPPQPPPLSATTAATTATINTTTTTTHPDSVETSPRSRNNDCWAEENSLYPSNNGSTAAAAPGGSAKLRLMCSYGGHIVPRPHDKTLCYVGGDTRIVVVDRHTTLSDLTHRLAKTLLRSSISSTTASFTLKYQLPSEDLDSLISVTTDEDLENMIDEYERLNSSTDVNKSSRLRLFLFPSKPESVSSIGSLLESTNKSEDWFLNALNGTSSMFSDTSSVNCLLGLEDDVSIPEKKDANHKGVIGKHLRGNNSVQDIQSVPDSPMLETSSSFGSASSSPSLANLPPVRVNVDDQQKVGVGIEEQFSHMSIHQQQIKHQEDVSLLTAPAPAPVVITGAPIISKVAITDNQNRVLSEDEKSEQGFQLAYRKQQQQQQQQQHQHKQSIAFDLPSPGSVSSDGSITRRTPPVVYQDPVSQTQFSTNSNNNNRASEHIPSNIHDQNTRIQIQDSAYLISTPTTPTQVDQHQQHPQLHHHPQFIHTAIPPPQYIQHHQYPSGAVPMGSYYQMYPSHSQGQHHAPRPLDQHNFVYYMPPPNNQVPPPPSSLFTGARTVQPATKTESPAAMYRTASSGPGQQQRQLQPQPQYVGYPTPGGNFGYEFTDPSKHVYYATPQSASPSASAAQYQTMVSSLSVPSPVEAAASHLQTDNNLRTTSQP